MGIKFKVHSLDGGIHEVDIPEMDSEEFKLRKQIEQQATESQLVIADKIAEIDRLKAEIEHNWSLYNKDAVNELKNKCDKQEKLLRNVLTIIEDVPLLNQHLGLLYLATEYREAFDTIYELLENEVTYPEQEPKPKNDKG